MFITFSFQARGASTLEGPFFFGVERQTWFEKTVRAGALPHAAAHTHALKTGYTWFHKVICATEKVYF
jgi:hypothetical protein